MAASETVLSASATAVLLFGSADIPCVFGAYAAQMHAAPCVLPEPCNSNSVCIYTSYVGPVQVLY
jgi:hypothetical protein